MTVASSDDLLVMVDDPSGTPVTKKITKANFLGGTNIVQVVGTTETQTLTNKTLTTPVISTITNSGTITLPTSTTTLVGRDTTDTLVNKTLTTPVIAQILNTGLLTLPTSTDTLVGRATTDTLTNKTLTAPVISTISNGGTLTLPSGADTLVARTSTDTLTNKTLTAVVISTGLTASGSAANDFSASSGAFKTSTGINTFGGSSNVFTNAITPSGGVAAGGGFAVSPRVFHSGGDPPASATTGTDVTPATTETYIVEVFVPANATLTGVSILNGSATAGNVRISLANSSGVPIGGALTASTAQAGTAAYQRVPFAVAYAAVGPATYYILVQHNNTGNRYRAHAFGNFGASKKTGETFGTFTTVTPPTTFTADQGPVASLY